MAQKKHHDQRLREGPAELQLLDKMRRYKVRADTVTHNAAISACVKGQQYQAALQLFGEMWGYSVAANTV